MNPFIDDDFLRRLENLKILAQQGGRGMDRGGHASWRSGPSLEFLDYRKYQTGDDLRYVDWNVFGRLDKLFIKLFRAEENQVIHILLDHSGSMKAGVPTKDLYAKKIAAAVSYIGLTQQETVCLTAFSDRLDETITQAKSKLAFSKVLNYLQDIKTEGKTQFSTCLSRYAEICRQPDIVLVISDLLDPKGFESGLDALHYARFDIAVIQVLDQRELSPTETGNLVLKEVETGETKNLAIDRKLLALYQAKVQEYLRTIRAFCHKRGIDYYLCDTQIPFEDLLLDFLMKSRLFR